MPNGIIKPLSGAINVSLAIFWSEPSEEPIYKNLSVQAAANPAAWSGSMTIEDRLWLVDKVETTAIFGERVVILNQQGDWSKVAAVSQRTQKNELGYPGWVLTNQIGRNPTYSTEQLNLPTAVVSVPETTLFEDSALTQNLSTLSYQTRLPILTENEALHTVRLPVGNLGYLSRHDTKKTTELCFDNKKIVAEAQQYLNLKYIWGGTSSYGFDCSGLMFRLFQSQGLSIPRDASEQAEAGRPVLKENLQAGDLLFFAKDKSPNTIHHVGMYIDEGLMIHSPNSKSVIRIEPFENGIYGKEYWGARRYCKN